MSSVIYFFQHLFFIEGFFSPQNSWLESSLHCFYARDDAQKKFESGLLPGIEIGYMSEFLVHFREVSFLKKENQFLSSVHTTADFAA